MMIGSQLPDALSGVDGLGPRGNKWARSTPRGLPASHFFKRWGFENDGKLEWRRGFPAARGS